MSDLMETRPRVRRLDPRVVAQIAAGEMILRPFSVAKELIENALDAGATLIEVSLGESADQLIEVCDDGIGMDEADLRIALEPHATSKLVEEADLFRVATMGFRGEALPSIGRVSRLQIITADARGGGWRVVVEGGETRLLEPAARSRGTTVRVEDLFFNSPVRKRYLKSPDHEVRQIVKLVATCALAFPQVAFQLAHRGQPLLQLPAVDGLSARLAQVHGARFLEKVLPIEGKGGGCEISGYVGIPELARPGTQHQTLLVNQRWVTAPWFAAALRQGYGDLIPPARHPFALVVLGIDPGRVDVNVHPTKREIRFLDEQALFGELARAVRTAVSALIPGWSLESSDPIRARRFGEARPGERRVPLQETLGLFHAPLGSAGNTGPGTAQDVEPRAGQASSPFDAPAGPPPPSHPSDRPDPSDRFDRADHPGPSDLQDPAHASGSTSGTPVPAASGSPAGGLIPLWQFHQRYIFAQTRQGLLIIDQHAAHERVLYERCREQFGGSPAPTQQLLFPLSLNLEPAEWDAWREFNEDLTNLGIDAEEFGHQTVLLRGVPGFWSADPEGLFRDMLHDLGATRGRGRPRLDRLAASFACRSAIRSGQALSLEEMNALVDQLFATTLPHGDPHGRPTFLVISMEDLDRRFGRSVG